MSPDPAPSVTPSALRFFLEHRSHRRYAIELEVRCKPADSPETSIGQTFDLSSGGIRFQVEHGFPKGEVIWLRIRWPCLLAGACPLQLVIQGRVVRSDESGTAAIILRHEFRTLGTALNGTPQSENPRDSLVA